LEKSRKNKEHTGRRTGLMNSTEHIFSEICSNNDDEKFENQNYYYFFGNGEQEEET
jgi:hypothetical protein